MRVLRTAWHEESARYDENTIHQLLIEQPWFLMHKMIVTPIEDVNELPQTYY